MVQVPSSSVILSCKRSIRSEEKQPASKHFRASSPHSKPISIQEFDELRFLLLQKAGLNSKDLDKLSMQDALKSSYSPRIVQLLDCISDAISQSSTLSYESDDGKSTPSSDLLSDIPPSSDDDSDAVVPTMNLTPTLSSLSYSETKPADSTSPVDKKLIVHKKEVKTAAYKNETEIAISRIFDLGKVAAVENLSIPADAPYDGPSVVTMTGFGELGRYGNQVLQYMFLKCYAARYNIDEIQVPAWVGSGLFGLMDRPVQRALPSAVEFRGTLANSTFTTDFIDYVKAKSSNDVAELFPDVLSSCNNPDSGLRNVDMWGWFQWHTSNFSPFKKLLQDTFTPVSDLYNSMHTTFERELRYKDGKKRTVVGLHLRLGDYKNIAASSFGYCAPTGWYMSWLESIWPTLENPVLFVASDDVQAVLNDFAAYNPVTADDIGMKMPNNMSNMKAGFFPDWFSLTQCDVLAISNSTFSFTACMMNQRPNARFFRAHYRGTMEEIDPWNADPIVHRDMNKAGLQATLETLQIVYNTQGSRGLAKNLLYELPYYGIRSAIMKAVLWRQSRQQYQIQSQAALA